MQPTKASKNDAAQSRHGSNFGVWVNSQLYTPRAEGAWPLRSMPSPKCAARMGSLLRAPRLCAKLHQGPSRRPPKPTQLSMHRRWCYHMG